MADLLDDHEGASSGSLEQEQDLAVSASDISEDDLDEFEPTEHARRLQRLAADKELLEALQRQGLQGRDWDRFVEVLARYGLDVMRAWVRSGEVFAKCLQRGWGSLRAPSDGRPWGMDEAEELALETWRPGPGWDRTGLPARRSRCWTPRRARVLAPSLVIPLRL